MPFQFQVTIDSAKPHDLAEWWADVLGWQPEPQDEEFIHKMIEQGHASESDTTTHRGALVWRVGAAIVEPGAPEASPCRRILFNWVPEAKTVKNRAHLDVNVGAEHVEAELARLQDAGATFLHEGQQGPNRWFTLADPEGNEFCIQC